jgi:hypothetical protein
MHLLRGLCLFPSLVLVVQATPLPANNFREDSADALNTLKARDTPGVSCSSSSSF